MPSQDTTIKVDGSLDWSGGVDSYHVATAQSQFNPNGLPRNCLSWLVNGTVRGGVIAPRPGWQPLGKLIYHPGLFQGSYMYKPPGAYPYPVFLMDGVLYSVPDVDSGVVVDLTGGDATLRMPVDQPHAYFVQGEEFLVIQAGDGVTLPLIWDGATLRRSLGLSGMGQVFPDLGNIGRYNVTASSAWVVPAIGATVTVNTGPGDVPAPVNSYVYLLNPVSYDSSGKIKISPMPTIMAVYQVTAITPGTDVTLLHIDYNTQQPTYAPAENVAAGAVFFTLTTDVITLTAGTPELPAGGPMDYYMHRLWYAYNDLRTYTAGDMVGNTSSGTQQYNFRDSILKVTENPLALGGDGFRLPGDAGAIVALRSSANINSALGQGVLYSFTQTAVYGLQVPVTRADWIGADPANIPIQYAVILGLGSVNDRSLVSVNGDIFYQTLQPSIQSLTAAVRNFQQWGDTPISINESRILAFNDRALLSEGNGIYFDNRMLQTAIPLSTPNGVVHQALIPLNFDTISTLANKLPPAWEGQYVGLDFLQLLVGNFGGLQRAFGLVISRDDGALELWELTTASRTENGDNRITCVAEFPAFTHSLEFDLKEMLTAELWLDDVRGTVDFNLEYRPDSDACYYPWHIWSVCAARDQNELLNAQNPYPTKCGPGYRSTLTLPHPPAQCNAATGRPAYLHYQVQLRLTIHGWCRVRGLLIHSTLRQRNLYEGKIC